MKIVIHVGLPKTATTTIQESLTKDKSINYLNASAVKILHLVNNASDRRFSKRVPYLNEQFETLLIADKLNVISYESFTDVITPLFLDNYNSHSTKILRLYELFGKYNPKIIITIRNQVDLFYSSFIQGISEGWLNNENYSVLLNRLLVHKKSVYDLSKIISLYKRKFTNVTVIGYETVYQGLYFKKLSNEFQVPIDDIVINRKKKKGDVVLSNKVSLSQFFKLRSLINYNNVFLKLTYKLLEKLTRNMFWINLTIKNSKKIRGIRETDKERILEEYKVMNKSLLKYVDEDIVKKYYLP